MSKSKQKQVRFRTTDELHAKLAKLAEKEDRSIDSMLNRILLEYFSL